MKIKLLKDVGNNNAGEVCTFPDEVGERLLALKAGVLAEEKETKAPANKMMGAAPVSK